MLTVVTIPYQALVIKRYGSFFLSLDAEALHRCNNSRILISRFHCVHIIHRNGKVLSFCFCFLSDVHSLMSIRPRAGVEDINSRVNAFGEVFSAKLSYINWSGKTIS